jgi:hypothetical protein
MYRRARFLECSTVQDYNGPYEAAVAAATEDGEPRRASATRDF